MLAIDRGKGKGLIDIKRELIDRNTPKFRQHDIADQLLEFDRVDEVVHYIYVAIVDCKREVGILDGVDALIDRVRKHAVQQYILIHIVQFRSVASIGEAQGRAPAGDVVD